MRLLNVRMRLIRGAGLLFFRLARPWLPQTEMFSLILFLREV